MNFEEYYKMLKEKVLIKEENNGWMFLDLFRRNDHRFLKLQDRIAEDNLFTKEGFGREKNQHITLLYGQNDLDFMKIKNEIKKVKPFKIKFGNISKFENDGHDVIKIEIISSELNKLHYSLKEKFENKDDFPEYKPHCTIAYVLPNTCDDILGKCDLTDDSVLIDKVVFEDSADNKNIINL